MMRRMLVLLALGFILILAVAAAAAAPGITLYVSTQGRDTWSGTLPAPNRAQTDGPFATLQRARDELRRLKGSGGLASGAQVLVRQGTYFLSAPFELGPQDSGARRAEIVYAPYHGEQVSLKGGVALSGWRPFRGSIYQAQVSDEALRGGRFWQLYYKSQRQILARTPNADPAHPRSGGFAYVAGVVERGSKTLLQYNPARIDPSKWSRPEEARVHIWSWLNWNRNILPIKSVDREKSLITLAQPASYMLIEGNRFFVENIREALDAPGEWYLDTATKTVYFWPPAGVNPEGQVSVPVLPQLISLQGDVASGKFVSDVRLDHFRLSETRDSLVVMSQAERCTLSGCTLTGSAGTAVRLREHASYNRVAGCDIAHVGGSAIVIEDGTDWTHTLAGHPAHNVIDNNHVSDVGEYGDAWGAICIWPGCGGNSTHDNVISHNLVHDTPRQGITFNGQHNIVEYNHVHHTNQEQSDTGAIGMGSRDIYERGSLVRYNYIHDTGGYNMTRPGVWTYPHYCWGVYLDDYTSGVTVYGNLIVRTYLGGVMVHGGQDNAIENNIIVDGFSQQLQYAPIDSLTSGRTPGHPDTSMWLMQGNRCVGNVFSYTGEKTLWAAGSKWQQALAESDRNLIWHHGAPVKSSLPGVADGDYWAAWQKLGFDAHSVIADPRFVNPAKDDYRLRPDSPAFKLGFKPLPLEKMGLYQSPERASWPVADNPAREEHLIYPEGIPPAVAARVRGSIPTLPAAFRATPPVIDGKVEAPEWNWEAPGARATIAELSLEPGRGKQPSYAVVNYDRENLYLALLNKVSDAGKLNLSGGTWGQDDGAEICLQDISGSKPGPILVIHAYPSGRCEAVGDAGAPGEVVKRVGQALQCAATSGPGQWCAELKIPCAALGLSPEKAGSVLFNIGVLKRQEGQWIAWVSTEAAPWRLEKAGKLIFTPHTP